jgi:hypothetical protein
MKKSLVYAIVLMAFCAPLFAGTYVWPTVILKPIVNCCPQNFCIDPGTKKAVDDDGRPIIDPVTQLQLDEVTFEKLMHATAAGSKIIFQSATLIKCHPERKAVCIQWCEDDVVQPPVTVPPTPASEGIRLCWPLAYETNGTEWQLTINYATTRYVSLLGLPPSKSHTEIYKWLLKADEWSDLEQAICLFWKYPVGQCELSMISSTKVRDRLLWFLNGTPAQPWSPAIKGFKDLALAKDRVGWDKLYVKYKEFLEKRFGATAYCWPGCCYPDPADPCVPQPDASIHEIIDTCAAPVGSILLTDLWEIGKALGMMSDAD